MRKAMGASDNVTDITDQKSLQSLRRCPFAIVLFHMMNCGPCINAKPKFANMASANKIHGLQYFMCQANPPPENDAVRQFIDNQNLTGFPTFMYFAYGQRLGEAFHGVPTWDEIQGAMRTRKPKSQEALRPSFTTHTVHSSRLGLRKHWTKHGAHALSPSRSPRPRRHRVSKSGSTRRNHSSRRPKRDGSAQWIGSKRRVSFDDRRPQVHTY